MDERNEQIIEMLAEGLSSKEMSKIIFLSHRTIEKLIGQIKDSFEAKNIPHLVAIVQERKLMKKHPGMTGKSEEEIKAEEIETLFGNQDTLYTEYIIKEINKQLVFWHRVNLFIKKKDVQK